MSHLSLEDLARLLDEPPAPGEAAHLEACAECRAELDAMRAELRELRRLGPLAPPAGAWDALAARLVHEGALAPRAGWGRPLLRLAAALAIFALGGVAGALVRGAPAAGPVAAPVTGVAATNRPPATPAMPAAGAPAAPDLGVLPPPATPQPAERAEPAEPAAPVHIATVQPEEDEPAAERGATLGTPDAPIRTPEDAARAVRSAERAYLAALRRYAELASPTAPEREAVARLAALESIVLTTRAALNEAPADPIINGYHLAALAQRDAAIRQVSAKGSEPWF